MKAFYKTLPLFFTTLFTIVLPSCHTAKEKEKTRTEIAQEMILGQSGDWNNFKVFIRAFKFEEELEIWTKAPKGDYQLLKTYSFCNNSGQLGPKLKEGDRQIPEGFYHIDRFNPHSKFHLSLGLNYPNAFDITVADNEKPGSDIFIHGGCLTIGCIPITNAGIDEVYSLCEKAAQLGQTQIPVHIFPCKMDQPEYLEIMKDNTKLVPFWSTLRPNFIEFEKYKRVNNSY